METENEHWMSINTFLSQKLDNRLVQTYLFSPIHSNSSSDLSLTLYHVQTTVSPCKVENRLLFLSWKPTFRLVWICWNHLEKSPRERFLSLKALSHSHHRLLLFSNLWQWKRTCDVEYEGQKTSIDWAWQLFCLIVWCKLTCFFQFIEIHYQTSHWHYITFKRRCRHAKWKTDCVSCPGNLLSDLMVFVENHLEMSLRVFEGSKSKQSLFIVVF
jgi:hypothetical protein